MHLCRIGLTPGKHTASSQPLAIVPLRTGREIFFIASRPTSKINCGSGKVLGGGKIRPPFPCVSYETTKRVSRLQRVYGVGVRRPRV